MNIQDLNQKEQEYVIKYLKIPDLLPVEENKLLLEVKRNNIDAKKKVLEANIKLIWNVIEEIEVSDKYRFDMLWEAGNNGLFHAITNYSQENNLPFKRFALQMIKEYISKKITALR
ncbi:MAG: hypothetical protein PHV06_09540 [bacterium]|nr:hypothetical protein [bacterium]